MSPLEFTLSLAAISVAAGFLGAMIGLGGGIVIVPTLTLLYGIDIRYAIGASIVSVIATSSGAAAAYVRERLTNLRTAMLLELGTTTGAITGAFLSGLLHPHMLYLVFGAVMAITAIAMFKREEEAHGVTPHDPIADRLRLHGAFFDEASQSDVEYKVAHTRVGLLLMYVAGTLSGLLGIGSGVLKVPAMDLAMRMPIKVSTATSNLMIGVTAAASAGVYFSRGDIDPIIAAPVAIGVVIGATLGTRVMARTHNRVLRIVFVAVLLFVSVQMIWKGAR